jgi:hypothetical protein
MYKKMGTIGILLGLCAGLAAQVSLQASIPTVGLVQKNQLWNLTLVNSSTRQFDCRLQLLIRDRSTGQEVITATTGQFVLAPGAKQLNINMLAPVQYNYLSAFTGNQLQGLLPVGTYTACYTLTADNIKENNLAEECVQFDAEPLSPPMLNFPADSSQLETAPGQFTWLPPMPAQMFTRLQYDILVTEVKDGQKAAEAIEANLAQHAQGNLLTNQFNYTANLPKLETNKWYAWQIIAKDNNSYAAKSEVWVFMVKPNPIAEIIKRAPYIKLAETPGAVTILHQGVLKVEYHNFSTDSLANIWVYAAQDKQQFERNAKRVELKLAQGQNYLQCDLSKKMRLDEQTIYEVMLQHTSGQRFYMRFKPQNYQ